MQADWQQQSTAFSAALLAPHYAVPMGASVATPKRFAVYRNNVNLSLISALEANFPALRKLLGGAEFLRVAAAHVRAHPPTSRLMFEYGQHFVDHLAQDDSLAAYPYLADVARLERHWLDAYHEADASVLNGEALAAVSPEVLFEARFTQHPALRLMRSDYAVHSMFTANRGSGDMASIVLAQPEFVLVTRPHFEVELRQIAPGTYAFMQGLAEGLTLADAAERAQHLPDFELTDAITTMMQSGAFQSFT